MNLQKAEIRLAIIDDVGGKIEDERRRVELQRNQLRGGIDALMQTTLMIKNNLVAHVQKLVDSGEVGPEEAKARIELLEKFQSGVDLVVKSKNEKLMLLHGADEGILQVMHVVKKMLDSAKADAQRAFDLAQNPPKHLREDGVPKTFKERQAEKLSALGLDEEGQPKEKEKEETESPQPEEQKEEVKTEETPVQNEPEATPSEEAAKPNEESALDKVKAIFVHKKK